MEKNKKDYISDYELFILQKLNNFIDDLQKAGDKEILHNLKNILFLLAPSIFFIIAYSIFDSSILLSLSAVSIGISCIVKLVIDEIKDIKILKDPSQPEKKDNNQEINEILTRDLSKEPKDFYREDSKQMMSVPIPEERENYFNALLKQKEKRIEDFKSRKALEIAVLEDIFQKAEKFNISIDIEEDNFNRIFDFIYSYLETHNKVDEYYRLIDLIMRTVLFNALSRRQKTVIFKNFISSFKFLQDIGLPLNYEGIDVLFKEIEEFIKEQENKKEEQTHWTQNKIIEFNPKRDPNKKS